MEIWILIMTICTDAGGGWGQRCTTEHIEFNSQETCENAVIDLKKNRFDDKRPTTNCVKK